MIVNLKNIEQYQTPEKYYEQIINLYSYFAKFDRQIFTFDKLKSIVVGLNDNHKILLYLDKESNIIGAITLIIEQKIIHNGQNVGHIEDLVVHEKNRNEHIGSLLLQHVITLCRQNNCYKAILNCNIDLEAFYIKKGFQKKGSQMSMYF